MIRISTNTDTIIELYLNSEKGNVVPDGNLPGLQIGGSAGRRYTAHKVTRSFTGFTMKEDKVRKALKAFAEQYNIELKVFDIAKTGNAFRAFRKGVRKTPYVIVGKQRFKDDFNISDIQNALNL